MKFKRTFGIGAALALALGLAACATDGGNGEGEQKPEPTNLLETIQDRGVLKVGIEGAFPPFNFYDAGNNLIGFDVDLTEAIANEIGVNVEYVVTPWDGIVPGLLSDKYDVIISSLGITEERKKSVDFTKAYYQARPQLFIGENSSITDSRKLEGKRIGVTIGTTFAKVTEEFGGAPVEYKSDSLAFTDLVNGRIDGVLSQGPSGRYAISQGNLPLKALGEAYDPQSAGAGLAIKKDEPEFLEALDKALDKILSDGTYKSISEKWFETDIRPVK